jgi:2-dehydropantoate 2-reductase
VVGAGGVGGYFAGALAVAGHHVQVLARGPHLAAMRVSGGLQIAEPGGERRIVDVGATDDAAALAGAEFVIVAVKSYSVAEVAPVLRALADQGSVIVPLLNGVSIDEQLTGLGVTRAAIVGGLTYISAARTAPGVVERFSTFKRITVGEFGGVSSARVARIAAAFRDAGVETTVTTTIDVELWRKFAFIAPLAAVCSLARRPAGAVRTAPLGRAVVERAVREVVAVGQASGVALADTVVADTMRSFDGLHPDAKPSLLLDVERGGPTELDALSGAVARLGRMFGVETPVHDTAVAALSAA